MVEGFRALGFKGLGFRDFGIKGLVGLRGSGFRVLASSFAGLGDT